MLTSATAHNTPYPKLDRLREWSGPASERPDVLASVIRSADATPWYVAWIEEESGPQVLIRFHFTGEDLPEGYESQPLRTLLTATPPARYEDAMVLLTTFELIVEKDEQLLSAFPPNAILDTMLAETRGYILYEYQLIHVLMLAVRAYSASQFIARALLQDIATVWDIADRMEVGTRVTLGEVLRSRLLKRAYQHFPPYEQAFALWTLLHGESKRST